MPTCILFVLCQRRGFVSCLCVLHAPEPLLLLLRLPRRRKRRGRRRRAAAKRRRKRRARKSPRRAKTAAARRSCKRIQWHGRKVCRARWSGGPGASKVSRLLAVGKIESVLMLYGTYACTCRGCWQPVASVAWRFGRSGGQGCGVKVWAWGPVAVCACVCGAGGRAGLS